MPWRRSILLGLLTVVYLLYIGIYIFPGRLPTFTSDATPAVEFAEVTDAEGNVLLVQMEPTETPTLDPNKTPMATPDAQNDRAGLFAGRSTPVPHSVSGINELIVRSEQAGAPIFTAIVRHGPDRWYGVATLLEPETSIEIVLGEAKNGEERWYFVETPDGQKGWINSEFVEPKER